MRRRRHHRGGSVLAVSFGVSAVLHLLVGSPLKSLVESYLNAAGAPRPDVKVVRLSASDWAKNFETKDGARRNPLLDRQKAPPGKVPEREPLAKKEPEPPKPPEPKPEEKLSGQIVEVPPTQDDSPNPSAKYLSKYNTHVDKETVARMEERSSKMKRVTNKLQSRETPPIAGPRDADIKTRGLTLRGDDLEQDKDGKPSESEMVLKVPDILRRDEVHLRGDLGPNGPGVVNKGASEALEGNSDVLDIRVGNAGKDGEGELGGKKGSRDGSDAPKDLPTLSALVPNLGTLARISGSPSRDHVDGVPEGDGTFLNAKEFKYATFFYRVRDSVADHWEDLAAREYRRRDPTGNIYGVRDRATLLRIQLNKEGALDDIRVEQTSGVDFLDHVAVEAFRRAQPFPNPPPAIADQDGLIRFNFQFIITMSPSRGLDLFRRQLH